MDSMKIEVPEVGASEQEFQLEGIDFISSGNQYLTFTLGDEHYGVDILSVKEIRGWEIPTRVPNAPPHVKGVINLRGVIVPVVDLRIQFRVGTVEYSPTTVVIVLTVNNRELDRTMGFVVDTVSDVLNADDDAIKKAPSFVSSVPPDYIDGLVNAGTNVVTLLGVEQLLSLGEEDE